MDNNLDELEEKLKEEEKPKKKHAISGRSVFKLQEIIKEKAGKENDEKEKPQQEK